MRVGLILAAGVALGLGGAAAAAPLSAYGKLPTIEDAAISPDGKLLALEVTDGETRNVVIEQAADQKVITVIRAGDQKVRDIRWADSDHLLITKSSTSRFPGDTGPSRYEMSMVIDYNLKTRTQLTLLNDGNASANVVLGSPLVRSFGGRIYAFVESYEIVEYSGVRALYRVDLDSGHSEIDLKPAENADDWLVDADGHPLVRSQFNDHLGQWTLQTAHGGDWRTVETVPAKIEHPDLMGFGADGHTALISEVDNGVTQVRELNLADDTLGPPKPMADGAGLIFDRMTDRLVGSRSFVGDEVRYSFLAPADQATWNTVVKALSGQLVQLVSLSASRRQLVVLADSPTEGAAYCVIDLDAKSLHWLGPVYDQLTAADIASVQPISYKAADGLAITGYLTVPHGKTAKNLPLIVFPHGGPASRDTPFFDWFAQGMASRGYAVLQVNYRGSTGFGWDFQSAGFGQWGQRMQTDLSDGVRYLAAQGMIDPKRVCIVGASYGGYAALAGAALDTGVYRCAVSIAGPADLRGMIVNAREADATMVERYWDRYMGATGPDDPHLRAISPAFHANAVTIPLLLIHGEDDTVVPFAQSQTMDRAMHAAGKPVEFVVLKSEDHWLSRGDTRLQTLTATMAFVEKNNPPD